MYFQMTNSTEKDINKIWEAALEYKNDSFIANITMHTRMSMGGGGHLQL